MNEKPEVTGRSDNGVAIITVNFSLEFPLGANARSLGTYIVDRFCELGAQNHSCIVVVRSEVGGAFFARALFELYGKVRPRSGKLICVNYPSDYIDSLTSLGLTSLEGFHVVDTLEEAMRCARTQN